ncbi:MAG: HEAT repeat domain-containing protein, partial [Planctomycetota bacterium]
RASSLQVELRQSATLALGRLANAGDEKLDGKIIKALQDAIQDSDQQSKWFSMIAIAQVGGTPGTTDDPVKNQLDVQKHLVKNLSGGKSRGRPWAALALGVMGHLQAEYGAVPSSDVNIAIRDAMTKVSSPQDIGAYALGAALRGDQEAKSLIAKKLFDQISQDDARGDLAVALGLLEAREHIEGITKIVQDAKYRPDLLKQTAISLGLLGDKATVPELLKMLQDANSLATQAAIATALGFIGDSRSIDPLVDMVGDEDLTALARAFAAVALGNVADKEMLPWNSKVSVDINYRANTVTLTGGKGTGLLDIL